MSIFLHYWCLLFMLSVTACIGSSGPMAHLYGSEGQRQYGAREVDTALNQKFIGMTKDQLIVEYGPPSYSATLDNGTKLMQYNSKRTYITHKGNRHISKCELRLWLRHKKVHHVDYLGDQSNCNRFAITARKNIIDDDRPPR